MSTEFFNDQWRIPSNENQNKVSNYSMDLDGSVDYVQIGPYPNNVFLQPSEAELNATGYSVSAWIKIDSSFASTGGIFANDGIPQTGKVWGIEFKINSDRTLRIDKGDGTGRFGADIRRVITTETVPLNAWTHVAFVLPSATNTTWQIYINGVASTLSTGGSGGAVAYSSIYYGGIGRFRFEYFQGKIDQVSIFDYGLSATEVSTLYGGGTAVTNPMTLSPIAYYQLGDQSVDNGANLLVPNNSLSDYVFNFVNPSDGINVPSSNVFNFGTGDFTISMWFKINSFPSFPYLFDFRPTSSPLTDAPGVYISTTTNRLNLFGGGTIISAGAGKILATGVWYNFVVKRSGNTFTTHYDGASADQTGTSTVNFNTDLEVHIGSKYDNLNGFDGEISNFQVFNTALPQTGSNSIETIYNNGSPLTSMSGFTSLVAWYKLNAADTFDGTNWTINDYGSGGNDGTSVGMDSSNLVVSDLQQTSGYSPYALSLDGANDYLKLNNTLNNSILFGQTSFTISAWIYLSSINTPVNNPVISHLGNNAARQSYMFRVNNLRNIAISLITTTGSFQLNSGSGSFEFDKWEHITITLENQELKCYLNGSQVGSTITNVSGSVVNSVGEGYIGARGTGVTTQVFGGNLSNIAVWQGSVQNPVTLYNNGIPSDLTSLNPSAWWQLGSNSSFDTNWTCLNEGSLTGFDAVSVNMTNDDIVDGVGYSASGLGTSSIDIKGDAPYSTANGLSENMDVLDRVTDVPS